MAMRDRERGTVFWSFGYPENIDQTHQLPQISSSLRIQKLPCIVRFELVEPYT